MECVFCFYWLADVQIEVIFSGEYAAVARDQASNLLKKLAQTASDTFGDFEDAVEKDATKTPVLDGTVHPLTSYVINYVKFLLEYVIRPSVKSASPPTCGCAILMKQKSWF